MPILKKKLKNKEIDLQAILTTHHHADHSGGNLNLKKEFPHVTIYGGSDQNGVSHVLQDKETLRIGNVQIEALHTPCHTRDSICFYAHSSNEHAVFTGDTLFNAGCGRFFEGTAAEMHIALNAVLSSLPNNTVIYVSDSFLFFFIFFYFFFPNKFPSLDTNIQNRM